MTDLASFVRGLPKAELHLHIEGSLEPEQMFAFGKRNKVDIPFKSVEEASLLKARRTEPDKEAAHRRMLTAPAKTTADPELSPVY